MAGDAPNSFTVRLAFGRWTKQRNIGLEMRHDPDNRGLVVNDVRPQSVAARHGGIVPGDVVTAIQGHNVAEMSMDQVAKHIRFLEAVRKFGSDHKQI